MALNQSQLIFAATFFISGCTLLVGQTDNKFENQSSDTDTDTDTDTDIDTDSDTDADNDTDTDADSDSDTDIDTDTDTDSDTDSDTDTDTNPSYSVGGTVTGLQGGTVKLVLNGAQQLDVSEDGGFEFENELPLVDTYSVEVDVQPTDRMCEVANGSGSSTGDDVTDVEVTCVSDVTALASLTVSVGELLPAFSPETPSYTDDVALFSQCIHVTPTAAHEGASIKVNDVAVESGAESGPIALNLGDNTINIIVTAESGSNDTYSITVSRASTAADPAYIKASNTGEDDLFGLNIALDSDTLAVGAYGESSNATDVGGAQDNDLADYSGAVYVFTLSGGTWTQQAYIKASNTEAGDRFGRGIALDGDTLAVGAYSEDSASSDQGDNTAEKAGAVFVFTRSEGNWTQQAYIKASNPGEDDQFGISLALDGNTLAVGAHYEDSSLTGVHQPEGTDINGSPDSGAVYVFTRTGETWSQQAYIKAFDNGAGDLFGTSVALDGDTLAVGAHREDSDLTGVHLPDVQTNDDAAYAGAVYVYKRTDTTWEPQAYIKASNSSVTDYFGWSIALDGDTLAVGAYGEASNATGINGDQENDDASSAGAVYVFTRAGDTWSQQAYIKASNTDMYDNFGHSVSLFGDALAVGAYGEASGALGFNPTGGQDNNGAGESGAVYVYTRSGETWCPDPLYVKATNTGGGDQFGQGNSSIAISEDMLVVGAWYEQSAATDIDGDQGNNNADHSGAVYVYR